MSSKEEQIRRLNELKAAESEAQKKGEAEVQELAKGNENVRQFLEASQIHKKEATGLRSLVGARNFSEELNCINELIQNVDDLSYSDRRPELEITLRQCRERGRLTIEFWTNEDGFTEDNVEAICSYASSTKEKDPDSTGEKGIGFKSVFALCESVEIHSSGYHFEFKNDPEEEQARPHWIENRDRWFEEAGTKTILVLPSSVEERKIAKQLDKRITGSLISFLRKVKKVSFKYQSHRGEKRKIIERQDQESCIDLSKTFLTWYESNPESFDFSKFQLSTREITEKVEIHGEEESKTTSRWLLISGRIDEADLERKRRDISEQDLKVEVGVPLDQLSAQGTGGLYTQMPVKSLANSPIRINAQFELTTNREDIASKSKLNEAILNAAGQLCAVGTCATIHADECSWSFAFNNFKRGEASNLVTCWESMHACAQMSPCIPTSSGQFVRPKEALRVKNNRVHDLIEASVRRQLYDKDFAHTNVLNVPIHLKNIEDYSWADFLEYARSLENGSCEYPDNQRDFFEALKIESTNSKKASRLNVIKSLKIVRGRDGKLRSPPTVVLGRPTSNSTAINRYITFCDSVLHEISSECDQLKAFLLDDLGLIPDEPENLLERIHIKLEAEAEPNYQDRLCILEYLQSLEGISKKEKYDKLFKQQVKVRCKDGIWRSVNEAYAPFLNDAECAETLFSHVQSYAEELQICTRATEGRSEWFNFLVELGAKTSLIVSRDRQLTKEFHRFIEGSTPGEKTEWLTWALNKSKCAGHDWKALSISGMQNWVVKAKNIHGATFNSKLYKCKLNTTENKEEFEDLSLYVGDDLLDNAYDNEHLEAVLLFKEPNARSSWLSVQAMLLDEQDIVTEKYNRLMQLCTRHFHDEFSDWEGEIDEFEVGDLVEEVGNLLSTESRLLAEVIPAESGGESHLECCLLDSILIKSNTYFSRDVHRLLDVGVIDPAKANQKKIPKDKFKSFLAGLGLKEYAHADKVCDAINLLKVDTNFDPDDVRTAASKLFKQLEANAEEAIEATKTVFIPGSDGHWYEPGQAKESIVFFWHSDTTIQDIIREVEKSPFIYVNLEGSLRDYLCETWDIRTLDDCVEEEVDNIPMFESMAFDQAFGPDDLERYTRSALECFYYTYRKNNKHSSEKTGISSLRKQLQKLTNENDGILKSNVHICHGPVLVRYMKNEKNRSEEITNSELPLKKLQGEWHISRDDSEIHALAVILQDALGLDETYADQIHRNAIGTKIKYRVDLPEEIMTEVVNLGHVILEDESPFEEGLVKQSTRRSDKHRTSLDTKDDLSVSKNTQEDLSKSKSLSESPPGTQKIRKPSDHTREVNYDTGRVEAYEHDGDALPQPLNAAPEGETETPPEPPIRPKSPNSRSSSGHSNKRRKSRPKPRQLTAVAAPKLTNSEKDERQKQIDEVDRAAIKAVMNYEKNNGRRPVEMPHSNKGYDIESESSTDEIRYIEVKGTSGLWSCVQVSFSQFEFSQNHRNTWLYVVENALKSNAKIHRIPNFASNLDYLQFGSEWITCSTESTNGPKFESGHIEPQNLEVGAVYNDDEIIEKIEASGEITRLTLKHRQTQELRSINIASPSEG